MTEADADGSGFNQSGIRLYFHLSRDLTDFKCGIDHRAAIDLQNDSGLVNVRKPGSVASRLVWSERQIGQDVRSGFVRDRASNDPRVGLPCPITSTPGNTAPLWSLTVPLICAVARASGSNAASHCNGGDQQEKGNLFHIALQNVSIRFFGCVLLPVYWGGA